MKTFPPTLAAARLVAFCLAAGHVLSGAQAATTMPPLLDINARCEAAHKKNVDAMSECVVAESEARAAILRTWEKVPDAKAAGCLKLSRKSVRSPYVTLAKCLGDDAPDQAAAKR